MRYILFYFIFAPEPRILIVKRMGYGSKEINDLRINKFIAIIVGAALVWMASFFIIRDPSSFEGLSIEGQKCLDSLH